jgi:hypothetical protein
MLGIVYFVGFSTSEKSENRFIQRGLKGIKAWDLPSNMGENHRTGWMMVFRGKGAPGPVRLVRKSPIEIWQFNGD